MTIQIAETSEREWTHRVSISQEKNRKRDLKNWRIKNQLDVTCYFIVLLIDFTCFGHYYAHHQELATMMLITTLVVSFLVCCRLKVRCGWSWVVSGLSGPKAVTAFGPDTHPSSLYLTPNQQQLENQTSYVITNAIIVSWWWWA